MSVESLTPLLLEYRYWILIPLAFLEGPVVAIIGGTLAATGYFNFYVLCLIFYIRDLSLDLGYYAIGHYGGHTAIAERLLKKIGVTADHLEHIRSLWARRPATTMLIGKLSYGISAAFIVVAGIIGMRLRTFIWYGSLVAVLQYGTLLVLGYFFGATFGGSILKIVENIQYVILAISIAAIGYYLIAWRMRKKVLEGKENT